MAEIVLEDVWKVYATAPRRSDLSTSTSTTASSWCWSAPRAAARRPRCGWSRAWRRISRGTIRIGDKVVNDVPPKDRDIAMVFQNYALYPHMTVYDNMAFGLKLQKIPKPEIDKRVRDAARDPAARRLPAAQAQGALGRAAAAGGDGPGDRPRSPRRSSWTSRCPTSTPSSGCRCARRSRGSSTTSASRRIYVTHDQVEAMTMGDRVAVIRKGVLQQVDTPQTLYDRPNNLFVAGFIGSPAMNLLEAKLVRSDGRLDVEFGGFRLPVPSEVMSSAPAWRRSRGRRVVLGIRPEDMEDASLVADAPRTDGSIRPSTSPRRSAPTSSCT